MSERANFKECSCLHEKFREYFKIGISEDYILIRDDFPMNDITPAEFSRLCREMFTRNEKVFHGK